MHNRILKRVGLEELATFVETSTNVATVIPAPAEVEEAPIAELPGAAVATDIPDVDASLATATTAADVIAAVEPIPEVDPETEAVVLATAPATTATVSTENDTLEVPNDVVEEASSTATNPAVVVVSTLPVEDAPLVEAPVVSETIVIDTLAPMIDTEIEYQEVIADMDSSADAIEVLQTAAIALEEIAALQPELLINPDEIAVVEIAIASATAPLGDEFSETVSIEKLPEKAKEIWKAIIAAIKAFFGKIAKFFKSLTAKNAENKRKITVAMSDVKGSAVAVKVVVGKGSSVSVEEKVVVVTATHLNNSFGAKANSRVAKDLKTFDGWIAGHEEIVRELTSLKGKISSVDTDSVSNLVIEIRKFGDKVQALGLDLSEKDNPGLNHSADNDSITAASVKSVLANLGNNVDAITKIADKLEALYAKEEKLLDEIILAAGSEDYADLGAVVRASVLAKINRFVSLTSTSANFVQRTIDTQSNVALEVSKKIGALAAKAG